MSISVFDRGFAVTAIQAFPYSYRSPISDQGTAIPDVVDRLSRVGGALARPDGGNPGSYSGPDSRTHRTLNSFASIPAVQSVV
jgi:hypothetical protein